MGHNFEKIMGISINKILDRDFFWKIDNSIKSI